jgi:uncharacterized protein (TIGR02996 family)
MIHPDQRAFVEKIRENPDDEVAPLVYADWLEETGEHSKIARAEFIRETLHEQTTKLGYSRKGSAILEKWGEIWVKEMLESKDFLNYCSIEKIIRRGRKLQVMLILPKYEIYNQYSIELNFRRGLVQTSWFRDPHIFQEVGRKVYQSEPVQDVWTILDTWYRFNGWEWDGNILSDYLTFYFLQWHRLDKLYEHLPHSSISTKEKAIRISGFPIRYRVNAGHLRPLLDFNGEKQFVRDHAHDIIRQCCISYAKS